MSRNVEQGESRSPDEKLSLAIGRKGQNVRLAAQLTGWKLDIISDSKFRQMEDEALVVDALLGQQEIVVEAFDAPRGTPPFLSGATILPDGEPALILDAAVLV